MPDPVSASVALARADQAQAAARAGSGWHARYFSAFGLASFMFVLGVSLPGGGSGSAGTLVGWLGSALWAVFAAVVSVLAQRKGVTGRGFVRLHWFVFGTWGGLWAAAATIGFRVFPGVVAFWLPAAVVVSLPFFVGALIAARR